jgi:hypothetical protein
MRRTLARRRPQRPGEFVYGMLPPGLFEALRQGILARQKARQLRIQPRT